MIRSIAFVLSIVAAGPAAALSCAVPSVEATYRAADASVADYAIAVGELSLTEQPIPPEGARAVGGDHNQMVGYTQGAQFIGEFFSGSDFDISRQARVEVDVTCVAAWCGAARDVDYGMFFFRVVDGSYVLDESACPANVFPDAHPGMIYEVVTCHNQGC